MDQYEIIVVDDCSSDNSTEVVKDFQENYDNIRLIELTENMGVSYASNVGIRKAKSPYVIRIDADDYINRNLLQFYLEILNWNPDICFVYGDIITVNQFGEQIDRIRLNVIDNLYNHGAGIMFRKSCLEAVGLYDENIRNCEDYDLIKRVFKNFDGYYLRLPFYRYRRHDSNMTNNSEERMRWKQIVEDKHMKENNDGN